MSRSVRNDESLDKSSNLTVIDVNNVKCSDAFLELETDLEIMDFQLWASFSSFLINY